MLIFQKRDEEEVTDHLARYLPNDRTFAGKNVEGTNIRDLLKGVSLERMRLQDVLIDLTEQALPDETTKLIPEWESFVGIPDDCFLGTGTDENRIRDILVKLASLGVQTSADFEALAELFELDITLRSGGDVSVFPWTFPYQFLGTADEARKTLVIDILEVLDIVYPLDFPIVFGTPAIGFIRCIFAKLKPANVRLLFRQVA